jgi:hypothetical protein
VLNPYFVPNAAFISFRSKTKFSVSSGLPPRAALLGYSQSMSTPWKAQVSMKLIMEVMKASRLVDVEQVSEKVANVGPGLLKLKPPTAIHVSSPGAFSVVN